MQPILAELLSSIQDVTRNICCQLIQMYTNGDKAYSASTGNAALVKSESLLLKWDEPCLSLPLRKTIQQLHDSHEIECAICTARPSAKPRNAPKDSSIYFAEAEIGRTITGMTNLPLVAWGGMQALGNLTGTPPAMFLKPQPVQMLAAIACAMGADEWDALMWAYGLNSNVMQSRLSINSPNIELPESIELHVFDDMTNGLTAAQNARTILEKTGCRVNLHLWGISKNDSKVKALQSVGAEITDSIDDAINQLIKKGYI